jgi:hypothetical protein
MLVFEKSVIVAVIESIVTERLVEESTGKYLPVMISVDPPKV